MERFRERREKLTTIMLSRLTAAISRRELLRFAAALPLSGGPAMLRASEPRVMVPAYNKLSDEEEIEFGRKIAAQMDQSPRLPLLGFGPIDGYVNNMVQRLGRASQRPGMDYVAKVVNTPSVNAKSILGGHTYVYRGLLRFVQSESELAAVLAHEVGHVAGHHSANNIMIEVRAKQLYEVVKKNVRLENNVIAQVIQKLGGPLAVLALMHYQRDEEFQADMLGFYEMVRCNWDPHGMVRLFEDFHKLEGKPTLMKAVLSDHPPSAERAGRIRKEIATARLPARMVDDSLAFKGMKAALALLPAPSEARPRG